MSDRRYNTGKWLARLVAVVPSLVLLVCIGIYLAALKADVLASLPQVIAAAAGAALHREIRLGGVSDARSFDHITFRDVAISDAVTFAAGDGRTAASARQVDVHLTSAALLSDPTNAAAYISLIRVTSPSAYIERLPNHKFNFSNLFVSKPNPKRKPFTARIVVTGGTVVFRDRLAPALMQPAVNRLSDVNGYADFGEPRTISFRVSSVGAPNRASTVVAFGSVITRLTPKPDVTRIAGYDIHIDAARANAPYFTHYFLPGLTRSFGEVTQGRADVSLTLSQRDPSLGVPLDVVGAAQVTGGEVILRNRKLVAPSIRNIAGMVAFTSSSLAIHAAATVAAMPVAIDGNVRGFKNPYAEFRVNAPSINVARLHQTLPFVPAPPQWLAVDSNPSVTASAIGPLNALQFNAAFSAPSALVYGTRLTGIHGGIRYLGHTLTIESLIAGVSGRADNVQLQGTLTTGGRANTSLQGHVSDVQLAGIHLPAQLARQVGAVSGIIDADVDISTVNRLPIAITARIRSGVVHGIPVKEAVADFATDGRSASIRRFAMVQPDGAMLSLSGGLPVAPESPLPYDLKIMAAGANVADIAKSFGRTGVSGLAYFDGALTGSVLHPDLDGQVSVFGAGYGNYSVDHLGANIALTRDRLTVSSGVIRRLGLSAQVDGTVTGLGSRSPVVEAKVSTEDAEIASVDEVIEQALQAKGSKELAERGWQSTATGSLDADAEISGPIDSPAATIHAKVESGSIAGVDISRISATAGYANNSLTVYNLVGVVAGADLTGSGRWNTQSKAMQATVKVSDLDLEHVARLAGLADPLTGEASFTATATGASTSPQVIVDGSVDDAMYKNIPVSADKVVLEYALGDITNGTTPLIVKSGPAIYTVASLRYDTRNRTLALSGSIVGERISRLVAIARSIGGNQTQAALDKIPAGIDGALDMTTLDVTGPASSPAVHAVATIGGFTLGDTKQDRLDVSVDASYADGKLSVASLEARGPTEYVSASGTYVANGPLNARLDASNIPLSMLGPFAPRDPTLGGEISDVTIVATGTPDKPILNASLSMVNVALGSVTLDRIDSGRITLANDRIDISGVTFTKSEPVPGASAIKHVATVRGSIPFLLSLKNGLTASIPSDQPISLTAQAPQQSVSLFSQFVPALRQDKLGGTIMASLSIAGTLNDKIITGSLQLENGSAAAPGFKTSFRNINLTASFDGARGTITSSQIASSAGGYVTLAGTISAAPEAHLEQYKSAAEALLGNLQLALTLHASDFTITEPRLAALYDAGFQGALSGDVTITRGVLHPLVAGSVQISNAVGILPTVAVNKSLTETAPAFNPAFKLSVAIAPGGRVRSSQIDALADGKFDVSGDLYRPDIAGNLLLRSGRFSFPTAIFHIVPTGVVHFVYNPPNDAIEQVNITATTDLTISSALLAANPVGVGPNAPYSYQPLVVQPVGSSPQRYTVTLTIEGDLNSQNGLSLNFQSDPPGLTNPQILAALGGQQALNTLLVGGNVQEALQTEAQQILTSYALPTLLQPVEANIATAFGVEEFNVDYEPQSPLTILVTKQIGPRLYVSYTRYVGSRIPGAVSSTLTPLEYSLAVHYNFTNQLRIGVSTDDQYNDEIEIGGAIRF